MPTRVALFMRPMAFADAGGSGRLTGALQRAVDWKRNARSRDYMLMRLQEHGTWEVRDVADGDVPPLDGAEEVCLLWPDANGFGWTATEQSVMKRTPPGTKVVVLNGRGRMFELTSAMRRRFQVRRLVQKLWLGEAAVLAAMLLVGVPAAAYDWARGHK